MFSDEMWTSWHDAGLVVLSGPLILVAVIAAIRVVGLRSLSKMSSFDFAVTVAIGSIIASVTASSTSVANGALAIVTLFATQTVISMLRRRTSVERVIDNTPVLLMRDGQFNAIALAQCRVTRSDVLAKLREANALRLDRVLAVVFETTGDISVLYGDGPADQILFEGVSEPK